MENTVFKASKYLVAIWKFLWSWNNIVTMAVTTKLAKMIQNCFFLIVKW